MSTPTTNRTLSKGTMNLKFMNRVAPKPNIVESPVAASPSVVVPTVIVEVESVKTVITQDIKMEGIESDPIASTS